MGQATAKDITPVQFAEMNAMLQALQAQLAALQGGAGAAPAPEAKAAETAKPGPGTAERMLALVQALGHISMGDAVRTLKVQKTTAHHYATKLASDGKLVLKYRPEPSHLAKIAYHPGKIISHDDVPPEVWNAICHAVAKYAESGASVPTLVPERL